jgi:mannose-binding lectin 1
LGNSFGISAASSDNPDSFEVFKFVVTTESHSPDINAVDPKIDFQGKTAQVPIGNSKGGAPVPVNKQGDGDIPAFSDPPEAAASEFKSSDAQFADLHNRLQAMMKHIHALHRSIPDSGSIALLKSDIAAVSSQLSTLSRIESIEKKLDAIQADVKQTKSDLHGALDRRFMGLKTDITESHGKTVESLMGHIGENRTGLWGILCVVLLVQGGLGGAYLAYKRRIKNGPKKYL